MALERLKSVLFLCTANSARSILAEAYLNHAGRGRFRAYSAGSHPSGKVNPFALQTLHAHGIEPPDVRSKSWDEFAQPSAPSIDIVITVCDSAAAEVCPVWPGHPLKTHWGVPDPAAVPGSEAEKRAAFQRAFSTLARRIDLLLGLPADKLDKKTLDEIGGR